MTHPDEQSPRIAFIAIPAGIGLIFCLVNAAGADLLCLTSGCGIYAGYNLDGVSLDLLGAVGFGTILLLALLARSHPFSRKLLFRVLIAGLLIDTLLLLWQILYWPCTSCLAVALLLALSMLGALKTFPAFHSKIINMTLFVWFVAFIPVTVAAGKETLLQPWPVLGPADAPVSVYFSPTCPACEKTVQEIMDLPGLAGKVAFFPVAKNDEDLRRLARMMVKEGELQVGELFSPVDEYRGKPGLALRWQLARNKMALARLGSDQVPLVLTPRLVQQAAPAAYLPLMSGEGSSPQTLNFSPVEDGCSANVLVEESCD